MKFMRPTQKKVKRSASWQSPTRCNWLLALGPPSKALHSGQENSPLPKNGKLNWTIGGWSSLPLFPEWGLGTLDMVVSLHVFLFASQAHPKARYPQKRPAGKGPHLFFQELELSQLRPSQQTTILHDLSASHLGVAIFKIQSPTWRNGLPLGALLAYRLKETSLASMRIG